MNQEVIVRDAPLPTTRRRRIGRLVRFGAYAVGALLVLKVVAIVMSVVVSIAVVAVLSLIVAGVVAILMRR